MFERIQTYECVALPSPLIVLSSLFALKAEELSQYLFALAVFISAHCRMSSYFYTLFWKVQVPGPQRIRVAVFLQA